MKKYELLNDGIIEIGPDKNLYRIRALRDFRDVKKGDLGGYVESEDNLSHEGDCWIFNDARVFGGAYISGDSKIFNSVTVFGAAEVSENAYIEYQNDIFWMTGFGSELRTTTVFQDSEIPGEWRVVCGCFTGSVTEFKDWIDKTCPEMYQKSYKIMVSLIKARIEIV